MISYQVTQRLHRLAWMLKRAIQRIVPGKKELIAVKEGDECHVIDGWAYLGSARCEADAWALATINKQGFDRDVYQILKRRLPRLKRQIIVMV